MSMREREFVKAYAKRYWEMFNEIDGDFDEVAILMKSLLELSRWASHPNTV